MGVLCIDYGFKHVGVAISYWQESSKPLGTFTLKEIWAKIPGWQTEYKLEKIVVGLPSGKMLDRVRAFGKKLNNTYNIEVDYQDETLTSVEAKKMLVENQVAKNKRRELLDAYSACLILDDYLRSTNTD